MSEESKKPEGGEGGGGGTGWKGKLEAAKDVALEVYRDGFKESVQVLGHALAMTVRVATSPIVFALSYAEDATRQLFERTDRKLKDVPPEARLLVDSNISAPIILNHAMLGDREDAEELRDMYASQLASAIDPATASGAHPGYTQIIASLSKSEAQLVKALANDEQASWPYVEARVRLLGGSKFRPRGPFYWAPDLRPVPLDIAHQLLNLRRLGLIEEDPSTMMLDDLWKSRLDQLHARLKEWPHLQGEELEFTPGLYRFTFFGQAFIRVCVREDNPAPVRVGTDFWVKAYPEIAKYEAALKRLQHEKPSDHGDPANESELQLILDLSTEVNRYGRKYFGEDADQHRHALDTPVNAYNYYRTLNDEGEATLETLTGVVVLLHNVAAVTRDPKRLAQLQDHIDLLGQLRDGYEKAIKLAAMAIERLGPLQRG
ncbi:MAG: DUF4393 domain-containing protein [Deltaproteobacteria bacterium]|nr:DUF4393 domain-containing protein [Deltaproteobacteria bacterium]